MHPDPRRIVPVLVVLLILGLAGYYLVWPALNKNGDLVVSGTIEATEVRLSSEYGGRVDSVAVDEGDAVAAGQDVLVVQSLSTAARSSSARERIQSPLDGVVIYRSVEPGEFAAPGAPLLTVGDLDRLNVTVYVPEDRYGQILLGTTYPVSVDSYPSEVFTGTVTNIAARAEFTPRNVQTVDNRRTTVFAIRLALAPSGGKLKPGMPADVNIGLSAPQ